MTDHVPEFLRYLDGLEEGDEVGTISEMLADTPKPLARAVLRFAEHLGLARRGRYKVLYRTAKGAPDLQAIRWAPTHVYNIKFVREGRKRVLYTKCREGRLDKKLRRMHASGEVKILSVSEAWVTPWTPANRELSDRGIPKYRQVAE